VPWVAQSGNTYNLCLLDTNALSEIIKHPKVEGRGFVERFAPNSFAPCFTVYNLIELRRKKFIFKAFVDFFSKYPCFLLKPYQMILNDEKKSCGNLSTVSPLMNAFSQLGPDSSYDFNNFVDKLFLGEKMNRLEQNWRNEESTTLQVWLSRKRNFSPKRSVPNAVDADSYVKEAGLQCLIASDPHWTRTQINNGRIPNINEFPSLKVMLYSQYYRLYDPDWVPKPQEVTDVMIMSAAPYMDVVITEAFQAEILKKVKNKVKGLDKVEFVTLKDIRYKKI
jgi:hypothetical protein